MVDRAEIIRFVEDTLLFTPDAKTKFFWGTGVTGPDAWDFMEQFAARYGVDMAGVSDDIDYGDSDVPLHDALRYLWRRLRFQPVPRSGHFTIDHLVEVANRKAWFDPAK